MKYFSVAAAAAAVAVCALPACAPKIEYTDYISEKRSEIYLYSDDETELKIYCAAREQPYSSDGICGEMCEITEIYLSFSLTPENVYVSLNGFDGEMNYEAVGKRFTLSYSSPPISAESVEVYIKADGKEKTCTALNVAGGGTITCEQAVLYAAEYDAKLFESLKTRRDFSGEISVRLLYDEGCYYYVGVCDRNKNISAYLLDGVKGKVITAKKLTA